VDLINGDLELLAGRGEVLQKFYFAIEVYDEGFVFVFAKDVVEERAASVEFLVEDATLTKAGVNEKAEGEGKIGFPGEIGDGLRLGVLFEEEVALGESVDEGVVFIADGDEEIDGVDVDGDGSGLLASRIREVKEVEEKKEAKELFHGVSEKDAWSERCVVEKMEGAETGSGPVPRSGVPARGEFGCMEGIPVGAEESSRGFDMLRRAGIRK